MADTTDGDAKNKEEELEARMKQMEAEIERLKKERIAFEEERKRFEAEKKAFAAQNANVNDKSKQQEAPKKEAPAANAGKTEKMVDPVKKQPEKSAVVSHKGNYTEMNLENDTLTTSQAKQTAKLKITADMSVLAKKSSKEFKMMQKAMERFDKFMKGMDGRTTFTPAELEKYDKLSHDVYKASDEYLKKKENEMENRPVGKDGQKKQSKYEYSRVKAAEEIRETVEKMRQDMLRNAFKEKISEMSARCEAQLANLGNSRNKLGSDKDMQPDKMKSQLADNCARTIYYANRMNNLAFKNELCMKPGETMNAAINRLNDSMIPTKKEIDGIKKHPLMDKITEAGVKSLSEGKTFNYGDMRKQIAIEANKKAPAIQKANEIRKQQVKQVAKKVTASKQIQQKKPAPAPS